MRQGANAFVPFYDLYRNAGVRIAELIGVEAAMVSAGAASAATLAAAACMTGVDKDKVHQLPDTTGMKHEVIIQKNHRQGYDHAPRSSGARLVVVETEEEFRAAFNENTAMVYQLAAERHFGKREPGQVPMEKAIAIAHEHSVPFFVDAADEAPPKSNLRYYLDQGADLVCFSGGKGVLGPSSTGLLLGRKDLIEAAMMNHMLDSDSVGRGMKVDKEGIMGIVAAVERFVNLDWEKQNAEWWARHDRIMSHLKDLPGVKAEPLPEDTAPPHVPRIFVEWDEEALGLKSGDVARMMREGKPSIATLSSAYGFTLVSATLQPGEDEIVGKRLREILSTAIEKKAS
ncbi:MAG: aminotransferase class V-fold PLP-dependent enzyme [Bryobacterales bacterium]